MHANELALTVLGFIADGRVDPRQVRFISSDYNNVLEAIKASADAIQDKKIRDTILTQCMRPDDLQTAHAEAAKYNGLGEKGVFEWIAAAEEAAAKRELANTLARYVKKAEANEPVDFIPLYQKVGDLIAGKMRGAKPANQIDYQNYVPYMPSGIDWWDKIIGGIPTDGIIIVIAPQGTGKSYWQFYSTCMWLLAHPDKTAVIYTLEMSDRHYLKRSLNKYPQFEPLIKSGRLHVSGSVRNVDELVAEVTTSKHGFVGVDDMSKLAGEQDPAKYAKVLNKLNEIARFQEIPVQVLAQPTRESKKADRFISIYDGGWSSELENSAAMFITLNRVDPYNKDWADHDKFVPVTVGNGIAGNPSKMTDRFYICFWKFRDDQPDDAQQGVGAIRLEPGADGLYKQIWVGKPYQNKLWSLHYKPDTLGRQTKVVEPAHGLEINRSDALKVVKSIENPIHQIKGGAGFENLDPNE